MIKEYTKKFIEENPVTEFQKRKSSFYYKAKNGNKFKLMNGESLLGPSEIWSAQIEDLIYEISKNNSNKKINYENLKESILKIHPNISKREYESQREYENTINQIFKGAIIGFKKSKLEKIFKNNLEKEKQETPSYKKPFKNFKKKALKRNNLEKHIDKFKNSIPNYHDILRTLKGCGFHRLRSDKNSAMMF